MALSMIDALSLVSGLSENIGEGCAPAAKAAEAMYSELNKNYVSSEDFKEI